MKRLNDEQRKLAESHVKFVRGMVRSGQLSGYIAMYGYDDVEGNCMLVLCEAAAIFDQSRYHSFKEFVRWLIIRRMVDIGRKQNVSSCTGWDIDETFAVEDCKPAYECDERDRVREELSKLTPRQREVVVRDIGMGEGVMQIARDSGCSHNAVITSRKNALRNLRIAYGLEKPALRGRWYPMEGTS